MARQIVIVDDSQQFRRTAARLLRARGFELSGEAADGEQALEIMSRACPDGVLLDINLPGSDGFAVAPLLRSACPEARIVMTSADVDRVPAAALKACGAAGFVPKVELAVVDLQELFAA
jgi:DNA-binding NarL/FixJ family response regulator